jgi:hypothetical protein
MSKRYNFFLFNNFDKYNIYIFEIICFIGRFIKCKCYISLSNISKIFILAQKCQRDITCFCSITLTNTTFIFITTNKSSSTLLLLADLSMHLKLKWQSLYFILQADYVLLGYVKHLILRRY